MELAEALLRIPDAATRDRLIRDKIGDAGRQLGGGIAANLRRVWSTLRRPGWACRRGWLQRSPGAASLPRGLAHR